ncbi:hypothetical protein [Spiroplasma chrysopicola]|uniref:Uncharacterized protein n=1 Tax=Spiroplasma chrysopicola DF-1 TaxID=1276227 RepID=R4U2A1_9MOLU|nr:hypothetical protein [Spiroplasma chrysopicola]AGM25482.1 hypothetical protein SCHRY_v1c09090 [Spiroplasma chrysopicola DF-1]
MSTNKINIEDKLKENVNEIIEILQNENLTEKVKNREYDISELVNETCDSEFIYYEDQDELIKYFGLNDRNKPANENFTEAYLEYISKVENKVIKKLNEISYDQINETNEDFEMEM